MDSYILFGHGWDLGNTFHLDKNIFGSVKIIMLSDPITLYEPINTKHLTTLMKLEPVESYLRDLYEYSQTHRINMCIFDSNIPETNIPRLLLTTSRVKDGDELTSIRKIGDIREFFLTNQDDKIINVFLLPELLIKLRQRSPDGDLLLITWCCRSPLDISQFEAIQQGSFEKSQEIEEFILARNIIPLPRDIKLPYEDCTRWQGDI